MGRISYRLCRVLNEFSVLNGLWLFALLLGSALGHAGEPDKRAIEQSLRKLLMHDDDPPGMIVKYSHVMADLDNDGKKEVVVWIQGNDWCGSAGCVLIVLGMHESSFQVITKVTAVRLPIRILSKKTNGWRDLAVDVGGGGTASAGTVILRFDGKSYPSNPTLLTVLKASDRAALRSSNLAITRSSKLATLN